MKKRKISERAVEYILTCSLDELKNLSVEKIARNLQVNRSYLSRSFKIDQQMSLSDFILREKIHRAVFILDRNHEQSVQELSDTLGFYREEDFVVEFKNYIAVDPGRYRDLRKATQV